MENRGGSFHETQTTKRSRSLDIKRLYKPKMPKESEKDGQTRSRKRKNSSVYNCDDENIKKRSKKDVLVGNLKNSDRNSKKSLAELYNGDCGTGLKNSTSTERESDISLSLGGVKVQIPKRKRGSMGRKKFDAHRVAEQLGPSSSIHGSSDPAIKLEHDDSCDGVELGSGMPAESFHDTKENRILSSILDQKLEETDIAVQSDDLLSKKPWKKLRKKKSIEVGARKFVQVADSVDNESLKTYNDLPEEDEKNLEENAAMMLSSRFDPTCTGFSSNTKSSAPPTKSKHLHLNHCRNASSHNGLDRASLIAANRKLRPRRHHKERGLMRKRRHFYDIIPDELDPLWVIDKKIKVFCPIDENWYYGLVNDYDEERKLHHIKYDDRDEEWVDLQNENFKLLLLRCEVPGMSVEKKAVSSDKHLHERKLILKSPQKVKSRSMNVADDSCEIESEPIISWFTPSKSSSSHAVKRTLGSHTFKKQKISTLSSHSTPTLRKDVKVSHNRSLAYDSLRRKEMRAYKNSSLGGKVGGCTDNGLKSAICLKEKKLPIVYVRRHFRKFTKLSDKRINADILASDITCGVSVSFAGGSDVIDCHDVSLMKSDTPLPPWSVSDAILQGLSISSFKLRECRFELCKSVISFLSQSFGALSFMLFLALPQHGTLMILWPKIHLEMLFVDSIEGLRFLLFEGSLKEAVEFVFLVLELFAPNHDDDKFVRLQVPKTTISFKLVTFQGRRRELVFAFYNFFEIKRSKWMYLDFKLMRHCLLTKSLPLSEFTCDNIRVLQNGANRLSPSSQSGPSIKVLQKKHRTAICRYKVHKDCSYIYAGHSCISNGSCKTLPPFALSFAAAPSFFLSLHLELLMKHTVFKTFAFTVWGNDSVEHPENDCCSKFIEFQTDKMASANYTISNKFLSSDELDIRKTCVSDDHANTKIPAPGMYNTPRDLGLGTDEQWQKNHTEKEKVPHSPTISNISQKISTLSNEICIEIPQLHQVDMPKHDESQSLLQMDGNGGIIPSPNPTAPRTVWHRTRSNLSCRNSSHGWADVKMDPVHNGFINGPKKPRTQVSYSFPLAGFDLGSKNRNLHQKTVPHKRIRRSNEKRISDAWQRNFDLLSCEANVLVTHSDRGWRECGSLVVLELADQNEWKLAVKISGDTQFSYKAHQFMQPGSTNRYTHAMMWKGGKDWTLEFPDRGQWALFKEMHEECYNRNIRAASIKSIPIPGVCLIDENDDSAPEGMFMRSSSKYFRQIETDVEMALNPSRVLYDMDSEDEKWISENRSSSDGDGNILRQLTEEVFERTIDIFEKAAYVRQCDQFSSDEIGGLTNGVAPMELLKAIYEHWQQKRQKTGMPLIRHLQAPLWERYQQQVKEWELNTHRANSSLPNGCKKAPMVEKPQMFAFCMKPRGLEAPNKGSKQRSHRKMSVSGHNNTAYGGDHDIHTLGRRSNGYTFGDERVLYLAHNYEYLEEYSPHARFSAWDISNCGYFSMNSNGYYHPALCRNKLKKFGYLISPQDRATSYSPKAAAMGCRKNGSVHQSNLGPEAFQSLLDSLEGDEIIMRDASGASQHAQSMAKMKKERARRMFDKADLAIHKAVAALMTAEAMKASSSEDMNDSSD
ncbi:hypothetical protein SAY87_006697 [Trapa incisa]|uniref:Enhancer of polycomb-like protein n=1 Tax=Trapa incisa TaxID=236973 RepID=A0AAN7JXD3_9MYRT|nr:hypothetical protein SAY87_006697 [Trapa incisa]